MRYKITRENENGERSTVNRVHTFDDVVEATDLCQELNEMAHRAGSCFVYRVETVQVVPAHRL